VISHWAGASLDWITRSFDIAAMKALFGRSNSSDEKNGTSKKPKEIEMPILVSNCLDSGLTDWNLVLEICERASRSEKDAEATVKVLRKTLKCVHSLIFRDDSDDRLFY
jgi:hypothetical protein